MQLTPFGNIIAGNIYAAAKQYYYKKIWTPESSIESNFLKVHIHNLRIGYKGTVRCFPRIRFPARALAFQKNCFTIIL